MLAISKLLGEGALSEAQIALGYEISTIELIISLLDDRFIKRSAELTQLISNGSISSKELESLIGRLNHAAIIIPVPRHFLNRLFL